MLWRVVLLSLFCFISAVQADVVELTDSNFKSVLSGNDYVVVKFYAPWCGHCKALAPEYEKAAAELKGKAVLAHLDATQESCKETMQTVKIEGYPTMKVYRRGVEVGGIEDRTADALVQTIKEDLAFKFQPVTSQAEIDEVKKTKSVAVIYYGSADSDFGKVVKAVAERSHRSFKFLLVSDKSLFGDNKENSLTVFRADCETVETFNGGNTVEEVNAFLSIVTLPLFGEINAQNYKQYASTSVPHVWVFLKPSNQKETDAAKVVLSDIAKQFRNQIVAFYVDTDKFGNILEQFSLSTVPSLAVEQHPHIYHLPAGSNLEVDPIRELLKNILIGKAKPVLRSAEAPKTPTVLGLTTIVASNLGGYLESRKDVLVKYYTPQCPHCIAMSAEYEKLAKTLEAEDIVIGQLDASANDVQNGPVKIEGFPTIYLFPVGKEPIRYEGERTAAALLKFLQDSTSVDLSKHKVADDDNDEL